jgi:outer membrane protein TolC
VRALACGVVACGRFQSYEPSPIPELRAEQFKLRAFDDTSLIAFVSAYGVSPVQTGWNPWYIGLASLYLHPALREAASQVRAAEAAEVTAGTPPELTASAELSRAARADEGKSTAWSYSLAGGLTFETGGKRSARRSRARAATLVARLQLESTAWQVVAEAEQAAVRALGAARDVGDAEAERAALSEVGVLVRGRYAEGRVSLADVAQTEQELRASALALAQAARAATDARLQLARALSLPLRAVDSLALVPSGGPDCGTLRLGFDSIGAIALRRRADVGAAVAAYQVAEADLRVEIARQYPDLTIGPGIGWDQGVMRWLVSVGTPGILRGVNRGPIAEARAHRATEAARVTNVQDRVLVAADSAVAACGNVSRESLAATEAQQSASDALRLARAAYDRGEVGRTEVAFARLAVVRATRAVHLAQQRAREASLALEAALGGWTGDGAPRWPDLMTLPGIAARTSPDESVRAR